MTLFSYCIPGDNGAAPNPFWGTCTLAICKPVIRRNAQVGDWIAATGSINNGFGGKLIYAMRVDNVLSFSEYDAYCLEKLINKVPDLRSNDPRRKVGDCIYDFASGEAVQRPSVHKLVNESSDLGGKNVLISNHFYYFGLRPIDLPTHLLPIIRQGQGHKSLFNEPYKLQFVEWITGEGFESKRNIVNAMPFGIDNITEQGDYKCSTCHHEEDDIDEKIGQCDC